MPEFAAKRATQRDGLFGCRRSDRMRVSDYEQVHRGHCVQRNSVLNAPFRNQSHYRVSVRLVVVAEREPFGSW